MSKKKKNIRRKKSNNLLKGMAAAGAVVGGGTIFAGNNAVYAAENEQGVVGSQSEEQIIESQSVSESTTESLSQSKSETSSFESEGAVETSAVEGNTVQTNQENGFAKRVASFFNNEQNIMTVDETEQVKPVNENGAEQEAASLSVSGSVSGSISEVGSQISSESISGSEAESEMVSESSSISTSTEDFKSESESLSTSVSTSASLSTSAETSTYTSESESLSKEFTSASESFETQKNQTLEDLITNINNTKRELEGIRQTAIKNNTTLGEAYRKKADDLAKYLAQYNFYQKYGVGKVTEISTQYNNNGIREDKNGNSISYWNYERNNFFVKYQTADNKIYTGYFDWVAVKEKKDVYGNTLKDVKGNILYEYTPYWETNPLKVDQIMVIEKAPIYSDDDWYNQGRKFYYYEDSNGIHAYFSKKDITYWDSTSGRYKHQPDFKEIESFG